MITHLPDLIHCVRNILDFKNNEALKNINEIKVKLSDEKKEYKQNYLLSYTQDNLIKYLVNNINIPLSLIEIIASYQYDNSKLSKINDYMFFVYSFRIFLLDNIIYIFHLNNAELEIYNHLTDEKN